MLAVLPGSTRATVVFFSNFGVAYTCADRRRPGVDRLRRADPALFKLKDGERIVAAFSLDPRVAGDDHAAKKEGAGRRCTPSP